ncbi:uncharacterized protein LOC113324568 [Papaver somniferum]|uniref:uncharacterized protein LOC113324568 n=1 Tax=Papaver somniferum TaxID=3469 RepID=UPI000E700CBE|nr:uncharacterized protein LOC113324568 [Papaver somniferum]
MDDLPGDILEDILSRLPFEVDLNAKHVCTTWRSIIIRNKPEKPGFLFAHADHDEHYRSSRYIRQLFYEDEYDHDDPSKMGMYQNYYYDNNSITEIEHSRSIKESVRRYVMVGSCNGLVLARGFGYCPSTNDYKVVAIFQHEQKWERGHVLVYTLGTGKWRYSGFTDQCTFNYSSGIHINGALFWLHRSNGKLQESEIVAFDLEGEKFHYIALPRSEDFEYMAYNSPLKLLAGNNNLYLVHSITRASRTDIWVYKRDTGNKILSHWLKEFSIQMDSPRYFEALAITRSNAVLWIYDKGKSLCWYDPKTSTFNKLRDIDKDCEERVYVEAIPRTQSNVSLKELGETNVTSLNVVWQAFWGERRRRHYREEDVI